MESLSQPSVETGREVADQTHPELLPQDRSVTGMIELAALETRRNGQAAPERFGPYVVLRPLGEGGMAKVYLGEHEVTGQRVALKQLKPRYATDRKLLRHFYEESQALRAIRHPNVAAVSEVIFTRGHGAVCVMEYLEGETLADALRSRGRLPLPEALEVGLAVASGLAQAHAAGIVHRDVKPSNIYLPRTAEGTRGPAKLFDFGIAQLAGVAGEKTRGARLAGLVSPVYMSPEHARDATDARSDVYSLGVVLYEMLAGAPPFSGRSFAEYVYKHSHEAPPKIGSFVSRLRPGWRQTERVVLRCLAKPPEARYPSAAAVAEGLRQIVRP